MVVDVGGGTTDIAVISLGGTVVSTSIKIAGDDFDEAIVRFMRKKHNLLIGERTAEDIKIKIGSCFPRPEVDTLDVRGRNLVTGLPKTVTVTSEETEEALTFRQTWQGYPLFTRQATLVCREGNVRQITGGRRLTGEPVPDASQTPITVATALISFSNGLNTLGDVCSRIDAITPGYVSAVSLSGPMTLTPVWRITTDTGAYQLDMVTGQVSRLE